MFSNIRPVFIIMVSSLENYILQKLFNFSFVILYCTVNGGGGGKVRDVKSGVGSDALRLLSYASLIATVGPDLSENNFAIW